MTNILSSPCSRDTSSPTPVFLLITTVAAFAWLVGWGVRGNQVLNEMKEDPVRWVSKLPLKKQGELKEYLKSFPDELIPQTVLPEVETIDKGEKPQ
jgi:hypothetical protein